MSDPNPYRYGPTRGELWFWLWASAAGLGLLALALFSRGVPNGLAVVEVVGIAGLFFGYLAGRSVKRLIRRQHP